MLVLAKNFVGGVAIKGEDFVVARIKSGVLKDRIFASFSEKGVG